MILGRPSPPRPIRQVKPLSPPLAQQQSIPTAAMKHLNLNEPAVADTSQPQQLIQPTPTQQLSQPTPTQQQTQQKTQCISKPKGVTGTP